MNDSTDSLDDRAYKAQKSHRQLALSSTSFKITGLSLDQPHTDSNILARNVASFAIGSHVVPHTELNIVSKRLETSGRCLSLPKDLGQIPRFL